MTKTIKIIKAKLTKELTVANISFVETILETDEKTGEESESHVEYEGVKPDWISHTDLQEAFEKLNIHLAKISEVSVAGVKVTSFTIAGDDDNEGIVLTGQRDIAAGIQNLNTPFLKWENDKYNEMSELGEAIDVCQNEVELYLKGKQAPKVQGNLFEQNLDEDDLALGSEGIKVTQMQKPAKVKKAG